MSRFSDVRKWIAEEKRYLWIVITLILFHSTFSLLGALNSPLGTPRQAVQEGEFFAKEARLMATLKEKEVLQIVLGTAFLFGFLLFSVGFVLAIRFVRMNRKGEMVIPWRLPEREVGWTLRDVFHVVVLLTLASYLFELFQFFLLHFFAGDAPESIRLLGTTLLTDLLAIYLIFHLVMIQKKQSLSHLGISFSAFLKNFSFGVQGYLSLLPLLFLSLLVSLWMADLFHIPPPTQPIQDLFKEGSRVEIFFLGLLMVVLVGPIIEEIFFRGFLYNALKMKWGRRWAILATGFLFALLHANWVGLLPITLLGCALAYGYELTGSLVTSMTIHILHNSLIMAVFFFINHFLELFGTLF